MTGTRNVRSTGGLQRLWRGAPSPATLSVRQTYGALAILLLVAVVNVADRELLYILLGPIKAALRASDTQMGLLTGLTFSLFYAIAGFPLARAADQRNRRDLLALCVSVWSGATALCAVVMNYWQLLLARAGVAIGEAASGPAAQSMLADLFPREKRTRAVGLFFAGAAAGHFVGLSIGGVVAARYGWRSAFVAFGLMGLLLALTIRLFVPEPTRGANEPAKDSAASPGFVQSLRWLFGMRSFALLILAFTLATITNYARLAWGPTFLMRVHGMSLARVGLWLGVVSSIGSALGNIASGVVTDRLLVRGGHWFATVPALSLLLAAPLMLIFIFAETPAVAIAAMLPTAFLMGTAFTPSSALCLALASSRTRGMAVAITTFANTLVGGSLGPFLIGVLNDLIASHYGAGSIRYSFLALPVILIVAALVYLACGRYVAADLSRSEPA